MFLNRIRAGPHALLLALLLGASGLAGCASTAETGEVVDGEFYEETRRVEGPVIEESYEPGMFADGYEEEIRYPEPIGGPDLWPYGPGDPSLLNVAPPWLPPLGREE